MTGAWRGMRHFGRSQNSGVPPNKCSHDGHMTYARRVCDAYMTRAWRVTDKRLINKKKTHKISQWRWVHDGNMTGAWEHDGAWGISDDHETLGYHPTKCWHDGNYQNDKIWKTSMMIWMSQISLTVFLKVLSLCLCASKCQHSWMIIYILHSYIYLAFVLLITYYLLVLYHIRTSTYVYIRWKRLFNDLI